MSSMGDNRMHTIHVSLMTLTEIVMLLYWVLAFALTVGFVEIDPELMYSDYRNPLIVAWNWSFLPIDLAFAVCGLFSRFGNVDRSYASTLGIVGATLMVCAGTMAVSFWSLTGDFDFTWWGINLWLIILGVWALLRNSRRILE